MTKTRTPRGTRRPIKVGGVLYPSISKASEATGVSWYQLSTAASKGQKEINRVYQAYLVATPKAEQPPKATTDKDRYNAGVDQYNADVDQHNKAVMSSATTHQPPAIPMTEWLERHGPSRDDAELIKNPTYVKQCLKWGKEMEALEAAADELSDKYEAALNTNEQLVEQLAEKTAQLAERNDVLRNIETANAELTKRLEEAEYRAQTVETLRRKLQNVQSEMRGMLRMARAISNHHDDDMTDF